MYSSAWRAARRAPRGFAPAHDEPRPRLLHRRRAGLAPDPLDLLDLALELVEPLRHGRERKAERLVLVLVPAGADAEVDAPAGDVVGGQRELGQDGGGAERDRRDQRAEPDPLGDRGERADRAPGVERAVALRERQVVVGAQQRLEAAALGGAREREPVVPADALLPLDHQREPHRGGACCHSAAMLRLAEAWIWDSWIADDGDRYHLFFLRPRARSATRACATQPRRSATRPRATWSTGSPRRRARARGGGWDDLALWTGSVARGDDGVWRMYYTRSLERARPRRTDQRLGLRGVRRPDDWRRVGDGPLLAPDPRWYRTLDDDRALSETWRDPFVYPRPAATAGTCSSPRATRTRRGCSDGVLGPRPQPRPRAWELGPPVSEPAGFGQIEVPQVASSTGSTSSSSPATRRSRAPSRSPPSARSQHLVCARRLAHGPWDIASARPFTAEPNLFAAPLVRQRDGSWALVGFRNQEPEGILSFDILDPIPVAVRDGELRRR